MASDPDKTNKGNALNLITRKYQNLFKVGAAFNFIVATSLMVPQISFPVLHISPIPDESIYLHLSSGSIASFGLGYYLASENFPRNVSVIEFGLMGKIAVNILGAYHIYMETISWQILLVTVWLKGTVN